MATVIIGAGIIGCSTAFYLTQPPSTTDPSTIHLVEASPELFASASGYGAGFLARDWFSDSVAALGALSFDLHRELAAKHSGAERWGYSRSTGTSLVQVKGKRGDEWLREGTSRAETAGTHQFREGYGPAWLTRSMNGKVEIISQDDSTAQVFVSPFSNAMLLCYDHTSHLHHVRLTTAPVIPSVSPISFFPPVSNEASTSTNPHDLCPSTQTPPAPSLPSPSPLPQPQNQQSSPVRVSSSPPAPGRPTSSDPSSPPSTPPSLSPL